VICIPARSLKAFYFAGSRQFRNKTKIRREGKKGKKKKTLEVYFPPPPLLFPFFPTPPLENTREIKIKL
jgi:hypothetical protein